MWCLEEDKGIQTLVGAGKGGLFVALGKQETHANSLVERSWWGSWLRSDVGVSRARPSTSGVSVWCYRFCESPDNKTLNN